MKIKYCWKNKNLLDDENTKTKLLRQKCKWDSQLIMFELTHIYKIWYKQARNRFF